MKIEKQGGWLAIEAMAAVLVMLTSIPIFYNLFAFSKAEEEKAVIAGQLKTVGEAFEGYVQDNYTTLKATATPTVASSTTFATLKAGGYVQAGVSATNIWGQGYAHYVLQPTPGTLEIITLTTGGTRNDTEFNNQLVPGTAVKIGSKGGYIPSGLVPGQVTTTMQGSFNGWQKSLAGTNIPPPGAGHLVYYSTTDEVAAGQDFLYRKSVPGNPDLNKMETGLNMGDNAISNVGGQTMKSGATLNMNSGAISNAGNITSGGSISATGNITTSATVTANKMNLPVGASLQIGSSYYYGDGSNSAIRQNGGLYVQHYDGSAADIASVRNVSASGNVSAAGNISTNASFSTGSNTWGLLLRNGSYADNAAPKSSIGSAYMNDAYIRAAGKWVSDMGGASLKGIYTITYPKGNMGPHICNAGSIQVGKNECYGYGGGCTYSIWCQILN